MLTTMAPPAASRIRRPSGVIRYAPSARSTANGAAGEPGTNDVRREASVSMVIAAQDTARGRYSASQRGIKARSGCAGGDEVADVPEEVLDRDDVRFAVFGHEGQVPEAAHRHLVKGHGERVVVAADYRVRGHDIADADGVQVQLVAGCLEEDVAVGQDADDLVVLFHQHAVDTAPLHDVDRQVHGISGRHGGGFLRANDGEWVMHQVLFELALGAG